MPYKDFKWEEPTDELLDAEQSPLLEKILKTKSDSKIGYFIEVDLEYPDCIKDKTKYYPLAPIKRKIIYDKLLDWQKNIKINKNSSTEKIICDQTNKTNYLCHYENLQFYVKMGMKIKKVHSIISFKQKCFMKNYILDNIANRKIAKDKGEEFGVTIFKLLNNAVFGKTVENLDKRRNINVYTSKEINKVKKIIAKPTFEGYKKFSDYLIAIETENYEKLYNKPIYIGFSILELSKLQMYKMFYETLIFKFWESNFFTCSGY